MDSYAAHIMPSILSIFQRHYKTKVGIVPGGMTPLLQGIDTHINKPFKAVIKTKYKEFMRSGEVEFTRGGNKKGPSYQTLVDWCSSAWKDMDEDLVKKAFLQTGVTNTGVVSDDELHTKLKNLIQEKSAVPDIQEDIDRNNLEEQTGLSDEESDEDEDDEDIQLPDI